VFSHSSTLARRNYLLFFQHFTSIIVAFIILVKSILYEKYEKINDLKSPFVLVVCPAELSEQPQRWGSRPQRCGRRCGLV